MQLVPISVLVAGSLQGSGEAALLAQLRSWEHWEFPA